MFRRTSIVDEIKIDTFFYSSIFQIGDSSIIQGFSRALAVQREQEIFYGNEGNFNVYPVFTKPIPFQPVEISIPMYTENLNPIIKVHHLDIVGVSVSSIIHIGSSNHVSMETRIKHIRQLLPKNKTQSESR
ncbi:spore germination protein GerPE [Cytobacillus dafuensis]|uniref:Spore germination protein GerPE n=1 Tax=Cytobacillus dafuensis TaxID=1742359 RepID=A0A5B8Z2C9_CYTDA|nr:spore germination protein GerPE [Cytobacillus dafuensis]QED47184.1 spore germination protein GerPE [Cytobacillus dafuensis]